MLLRVGYFCFLQNVPVCRPGEQRTADSAPTAARRPSLLTLVSRRAGTQAHTHTHTPKPPAAHTLKSANRSPAFPGVFLLATGTVGPYVTRSRKKSLKEGTPSSSRHVPKSTECYRDVNLILCLSRHVCELIVGRLESLECRGPDLAFVVRGTL